MPQSPHPQQPTAAGRLFLLPVPLSTGSPANVLPVPNIEIMARLKHFVVENIRTARRFLKLCCPDICIDSLSFVELSEHTSVQDIPAMLSPLLQGNDIGLLSEAGCPAVADPGAALVAAAQRRNITVVPLVGPSSILLSLMASGLNGQAFEFAGYLPIDDAARTRRLREMENKALRNNITQIFIETPYRNNRLMHTLLQALHPDTLLCVAADITGSQQQIQTRTVAQWAQSNPQFAKIPAIFLIGTAAQ